MYKPKDTRKEIIKVHIFFQVKSNRSVPEVVIAQKIL